MKKDNKTILGQGPDGEQKVKTATKRFLSVSHSLQRGDFWELYNDKDQVHFINAKAKTGSKNTNYYAFNNRDYTELNDLLNEIAIQENRLIASGADLEGLKSLNRNVWFDISRKSNAIEGIFKDFDIALVDFRRQLRGKFIVSDNTSADNFDFLDYFKVLRERERQIEQNNDSRILVVRGKKESHTLSLDTVRHYIAFKYAYKCAKYDQQQTLTAGDFIALIDNVAGLLSGNDVVPSRSMKASIDGDMELANWKPVSEDKIYEKLRALAEWAVAEDCKKAGSQLHPLEQAAIFHAEFIRIHPYFDGNGRTGRIMANYILMKNDIPTVALKHSRAKEYFEAINKAIETHDIDDLLDIFYEEALRSARITKTCLDFIEQEQQVETEKGLTR